MTPTALERGGEERERESGKMSRSLGRRGRRKRRTRWRRRRRNFGGEAVVSALGVNNKLRYWHVCTLPRTGKN